MRAIKTKPSTKSSRLGNESGKLEKWKEIEIYIYKYLKHLNEAHFLIVDYWVQSDLNVKSYMDILAFIHA